MGDHINADGKFQSDKYPDCPAGKVPLSTSDPMAQDLLWEYARRREEVDAEFSEDLRACLLADGMEYPSHSRPGLPFNLQGGLDRYRFHHTKTGGFLAAILSDDIEDAIRRADPNSLAHLEDIRQYVHWELPSESWGSRDKVAAWIAKGEAAHG
jgi:hypothetical protein